MKIKCTCVGDKNGNKNAAEFQDKAYGKGVRIATPQLTNQGARKKGYCTVCGSPSENAVE